MRSGSATPLNGLCQQLSGFAVLQVREVFSLITESKTLHVFHRHGGIQARKIVMVIPGTGLKMCAMFFLAPTLTENGKTPVCCQVFNLS